MRQFYGRPTSQILANTIGDGGLPDSPVTGQVVLARSGIPQPMSTTPLPLTGGVWLVSGESLVNKVHYMGTTDNKPTYDSGSTPKSTGVRVRPGVPIFVEVDDLADLWIDGTDNATTMTYLAF